MFCSRIVFWMVSWIVSGRRGSVLFWLGFCWVWVWVWVLFGLVGIRVAKLVSATPRQDLVN